MRRLGSWADEVLAWSRRAPRLPPRAAIPLAVGLAGGAVGLELLARPVAQLAPFTLAYLAVAAATWLGGAPGGLTALGSCTGLVHAALLAQRAGPAAALLACGAFAVVAGAMLAGLVALRAAWDRQDRVLARARRRSHQLARALQTREEFLVVAGHELRTPLTALRLQLEGLDRAVRARRPGFERLADERLARGLSHLDRLQALVVRLLEASRLARVPLELRPERCDFADVVGGVVRRLGPPAERVGSPIRLSVERPLVGRFDRDRLEELATNLLANAVKYGMGQPVEVELRREGQEARLTVRDRGIGLAPGAAGRIFERFARAAPAAQYGGLGLGLWTVRRIARSAGGEVEVAGRPGEGATFTVRLPLAEGGAA